MNNALYNTHVKLLAFDFLSLSPNPTDHPSSFSRKGRLLSRAETLGFVVTRELKPGKFLRFTIDDGTGCIPCVLWLNHLSSSYFSKRSPSGVRSIAQVAMKFASEIQLGVVARVRGRITGYRGMVQITVSDVVLENDPNSQVLHWLDCVRQLLGRWIQCESTQHRNSLFLEPNRGPFCEMSKVNLNSLLNAYYKFIWIQLQFPCLMFPYSLRFCGYIVGTCSFLLNLAQFCLMSSCAMHAIVNVD